MIVRVALALALIAAAWGSARAETLVVDLSTDLISVTSEFSGTDIALFGVIERDAQTVARSGAYSIVVTVRGPAHDVLIQRKGRRFGIWINTDGVTFKNVPSYYGLFTTAATQAEVNEWVLSAGSPDDDIAAAYAGHRSLFHDAFTERRESAGLYMRRIGAVEMLTDRFFRTIIPLPGTVEDGSYSVEVSLFVEGVLLDRHERTFEVAKVGIEQRVFELSRSNPLAYGLAVVVLALVTGYVGGVVFRRN